MPVEQVTQNPAFVVTGPTSGIGLCAALEFARHGTVVLIGRNRAKLDNVRQRIERTGGRAFTVVCDLSDPKSSCRAASDITALGLPIRGVLNNAGIMPMKPSKTDAGWDLTFATNYLGPFALTDALIPHLANGTSIAFVVSAIENPEHGPAKLMRMRGGRFISIEASARGEWLPGGAKLPGVDAYATSKQCALAATLALARENPRLQINAVEPGINPTTGLGGTKAVAKFIFGQIVTRLPPFSRYRSTPARAAHVMAAILMDQLNKTGVYYGEKGEPMTGSTLAHDMQFQQRVVAETRAFLAKTNA